MSRYTDDLLAQADTLLRADPRRPKQANLRRAVSSAYYALFHFLIEEATLFIVNASPANKSLRLLVGRGFTHTAMREANSEFRKATPRELLQPLWLHYNVHTCTPLQSLAVIFVELQQQRHRADYDLSRPFTLQEAQTLVANARTAMNDWKVLRRGQPELARFYALSLYSWNNWKGR